MTSLTYSDTRQYFKTMPWFDLEATITSKRLVTAEIRLIAIHNQMSSNSAERSAATRHVWRRDHESAATKLEPRSYSPQINLYSLTFCPFYLGLDGAMCDDNVTRSQLKYRHVFGQLGTLCAAFWITRCGFGWYRRLSHERLGNIFDLGVNRLEFIAD